MDEEERRERIIEGLKKDVVKLKDYTESLEYKCKECREIDLGSVYDRRDLQNLDLLKSMFTMVCKILMIDIFGAIEILIGREPRKFVDVAFYRNEKLLDLMEKSGVIDSAKLFLKILEVKEDIETRADFMDMTKLFQNIFDYSEELFKIVEKAANIVKSKYLPDTK